MHLFSYFFPTFFHFYPFLCNEISVLKFLTIVRDVQVNFANALLQTNNALNIFINLLLSLSQDQLFPGHMTLATVSGQTGSSIPPGINESSYHGLEFHEINN